MKKIHPAAEMFPAMEGTEFDALILDLKENGLREPIILHEEMILDGRNRYRGCLMAGIEPAFEPWDQDGTPEAFVISKNLHRRHLNESQRAMIAARLANRKAGENQHSTEVGNKPTTSNEHAARLLNVNRESVSLARKILAEAEPHEVEAVERGVASVTTLGKALRNKKDKKDRAYIAQAGKNPERLENARMRAQQWAQLKDALSFLSGFPQASDIVPVVLEKDRAGLVDQRLSQSLKWLKDFSDAWNSRNRNAA